MRPIIFWSFHDYLDGVHNPIDDWYVNELTDIGKFGLDSLLKNTAKTENHLQWGGFKFLQGEPKKYRIWQLDFAADGRQYRVLGIFDSSVRRRAVLLAGCYHKSKVYTPPNALDTVCRRAQNLKDKKAGTIERKIKHDI